MANTASARVIPPQTQNVDDPLKNRLTLDNPSRLRHGSMTALNTLQGLGKQHSSTTMAFAMPNPQAMQA